MSAVLRTGRGTASAAVGTPDARRAAARRGDDAGRSSGGVGALCRALFEEVVEIGIDGGAGGAGLRAPEPRAQLVAALSAATGERVLVVDAVDAGPLDAEVVLALVAWPEADAVVPVDRSGADLPFGLYRREVCLAKLGAPEAGLAVERVPLAALGLAGGAVLGALPVGTGG
ncbi:MAG: hypothetical protein U0900_18525 [Myxococcota bacterium]